MRKPLISLQTAILVPFMFIIMSMLILSIILWTRDYNRLVEEQGQKILGSLIAQTKSDLGMFLNEPKHINKLFASTIAVHEYYNREDLSDIQMLAYNFFNSIRSEIPQISVLSYGDQNKSFVGLRSNENANKMSLLLQDSRTDGKLIIYDDNTTQSNVIAVNEGYDPRTRPWYIPVKDSQTTMWSEIYVNQDEKREVTISSLEPVFDSTGNFKGVAVVDVKLNTISNFLRETIAQNSGLIYIVDEHWNVISESTKPPVDIGKSTSSYGKLTLATNSSNESIRQSATALQGSSAASNQFVKLNINKKSSYAIMSKLNTLKDLSWTVVVVIPENALMGNVNKRELFILVINILMGLMVFIAGSVQIRRLIKPILKSADAAEMIANGNWQVTICEDNVLVRETDLLVRGFNTMTMKINEAFKQLQIANNHIEQLHINEKVNLEKQVQHRTQELKIAMDELVEREKMASLGRLVTGVAHEINTPLGVAISANSYQEMLLKNVREKITKGEMTKVDLHVNLENLDESMMIVSRNLERASELIHSFKQVSLEQCHEEMSEFDVRNYIQSTILNLKPALQKQRHSVEVICDENLRIQSYPGAFSQIITNLIMNSITHGFVDKEFGYIVIQVTVTGDVIRFIYSDNGKGIAPDILSKVFDPFFTTNRSKGGSGLGLSIVYNIVATKLNGRIHCKSELEKGTVFNIEFPVR